MNKVIEAFQKLPMTSTLRYAPKININHLCVLEEHCETSNITPYEYHYDVKLHLGASVRCQEEDIDKAKESVCSEVNHFLYGEIYGKALELRTALWQDDIDRVRNLVEEIITYTRGRE